MPNSKSGSLSVYIGIRGGLPPEDIEILVTRVVEEAVSATAKSAPEAVAVISILPAALSRRYFSVQPSVAGVSG